MPANTKPTMRERVMSERGNGPLAVDDGAARTRRALLHGAVLCAQELPPELRAPKSVLPQVAHHLESFGYKVERRSRSQREHPTHGRARVDYRVLNPEHEPNEVPIRTVKPKLREPREGTAVAAVAHILREGREVSLASIAAAGFPHTSMDHLRKTIGNTKRALQLDVVRTHAGGYLLSKPPKRNANGLAPAKSRAAAVTPSSPSSVHSDPTMAALLGQFGGSLQLRGVFLDDGDDVHVALRNGAGTWDARIEGYHPKLATS